MRRSTHMIPIPSETKHAIEAISPMAGFERPIVDAAFFPEGQFVSQYLVNLGYGDDTKVYPRLPRFNVDEISRFV
jgi:3-hydroxypropanoate dehydrogenase